MALSADISAVYTLLQNAVSADESTRRSAEAALAACESRSGFCSCLMEIISTRDLNGEPNPRLLAAMYFKSSVKKYWRSTHPSGITEDEKCHLRAKILDQLDEPNNQIAVQMALLAAKIARLDYPKAWPELFPTVAQKLQGASLLVTHRVYLLLNQVLKELASKRLAADQRTFAEVTSQLLDFTWQHWCSDTEAIVRGLSASLQGGGPAGLPADALSLTCERWILCTKSVRRMLVFGFGSDVKTRQIVLAVERMVPAMLQAVQSFVPLWMVMSQRSHPLLPFVQRASLKLMKAILSIQATHPFSFSAPAVLSPLLDYCYKCVVEGVPSGASLPDPLLIQAMMLMQATLACTHYRPPSVGYVVEGSSKEEAAKEQLPGRASVRAREQLEALFGQKRLVSLCSTLVQRFFMMTEQELGDWAVDPESFHHEQDMVHWTERVRPCAEALYLTLFENYKEVLAPVVLEMLNRASEACPPPTQGVDVLLSQELLLKEAVYDAVGQASYDLDSAVNFDAWYTGTLSLELANQYPNGRILRRRVAWLLSQFVSKVNTALAPSVYESLIRLLSEEDAAVQLAAVSALRAIVDDVNFQEAHFVGLVDPCLQLLFQFMQVAAEFDSQLQAFNLFSLIIERLGDKIAPYAERIVSFLPAVWQKAEGQSLLRIQVVVALQRLVGALGHRSPQGYELLLPMLRYSTDITQPDELNMLEDGLQLWQTTLRHAPTMTPDLLSLFPNLVAVMDRSFDHLPVAMRIIENYILLGGSDFLRPHAQSVAHIFETVVGNVKEKALQVALAVLDTLIQAFPAEAPALVERTLEKLADICVGAGPEYPVARASSAALLARVLLQNTSFFLRFTQPPGHGSEQLFGLVDALIDKVDSMSSAAKRKLTALALCVILTVQDGAVLDRLEAIIGICTSVLHQMEGDKEGVDFGYDYTDSGARDEDEGESEYARRRQLFAVDPVNTTSLAALLKEKLQACAALFGEGAFNATRANLHPQVLQQLQRFIR